MTETDFSPEDPKYFIAKGTIVVIPALGIHYDSEIYPEPEKFKPERFINLKCAAPSKHKQKLSLVNIFLYLLLSLPLLKRSVLRCFNG